MVQAITVAGPISSDELGITMCHVHLLKETTMSGRKEYVTTILKSEAASEVALADKPANQWTFYDLGIIRRNLLLMSWQYLLAKWILTL